MRGFTLLEVMISLAILAISLAVLLSAQASSLNNAGKSRDMTVATLLARGKMIDIEKHLFHDGFQMSTEQEDGDFREEGHEEVTWTYRISEVELDLSALGSLCAGLTKKVPGKNEGPVPEGNDCESMLAGLGSSLGTFTDEIGRSLRVVDLKLKWPEGRFSQSMSVRALLSRDDFATAQESDMQKALNQATGGQGLTPGGVGGTPGAVPGAAAPLPAGH